MELRLTSRRIGVLLAAIDLMEQQVIKELDGRKGDLMLREVLAEELAAIEGMKEDLKHAQTVMFNPLVLTQ